MLTAAIALAVTSPAAAAPACAARLLSLRLDGRDGDFNGMSHSGTLMILRNLGRSACTVPGLPRVTFLDARGRPLPIVRRPPPGMHPGPVVPPVAIPPGGAASAPLRWVTGEVYDHGRCLTPARMRVEAGDARLSVHFGNRLCGPAGQPATFNQPVLEVR